MKYTFSFTEINYGSIEIEADHMPDESIVIDAIMNGEAFYKDTDYRDIKGYDEKMVEINGAGVEIADTADTSLREAISNETIHGYEIKRAVVFENNRGFALAENPNAVEPFVTWQFTEEENGQRDYYWGHYCTKEDTATRDYMQRIAEHTETYGFSERDAYKYYSTGRPVDIGTFPKTENEPIRFVNFDSREDVEQGRYQAWGYLVYDAPLTEKQISDYELKAAPDNPDIKSRMRDMAQVIGIWEEKKKVPGNMRFTSWIPDLEAFVKKDFVSPEQMMERFNYASEKMSRTAPGKQPTSKTIAEQLKDGAVQAAKDNAARPTPPTHTNKEDR